MGDPEVEGLAAQRPLGLVRRRGRSCAKAPARWRAGPTPIVRTADRPCARSGLRPGSRSSTSSFARLGNGAVRWRRLRKNQSVQGRRGGQAWNGLHGSTPLDRRRRPERARSARQAPPADRVREPASVAVLREAPVRREAEKLSRLHGARTGDRPRRHGSPQPERPPKTQDRPFSRTFWRGGSTPPRRDVPSRRWVRDPARVLGPGAAAGRPRREGVRRPCLRGGAGSPGRSRRGRRAGRPPAARSGRCRVRRRYADRAAPRGGYGRAGRSARPRPSASAR